MCVDGEAVTLGQLAHHVERPVELPSPAEHLYEDRQREVGGSDSGGLHLLPQMLTKIWSLIEKQRLILWLCYIVQLYTEYRYIIYVIYIIHIIYTIYVIHIICVAYITEALTQPSSSELYRIPSGRIPLLFIANKTCIALSTSPCTQ